MRPKVKVTNEVKVNPRPITKTKQVKFHFKQEPKLVNIDKALKRIYSITN